MTFPVRAATLALAPLAMVWMTACRPAGGDNTPAAVPVTNVSSLSNRPVISIVFTHPAVAVIQTRYRRPLMDHLTAHTPYMARALFHSDPEATVGMLEQRLAEFSHLGVVDYLEARDQLGAVPLARPLNRDGEPVSYSAFVTPQASPLRSLGDLKGHSLALGSYHSTLSHLIPRHELIRAGVPLEELGSIEYLENDEAIASAVLEGRFDAGAVDELVAHRYEEKGLRALHVSAPVPSAPIVARAELPQRVIQTVRDALLLLDLDGAKDREHWDEDIRYGFAPASAADYEPIRKIMETSGQGCQRSCHSAE
ncbi:MAG: PhnD/SsuA/transferrin family substrate-binding protein [Vicinamibacteria bacterium]